MALELALPQLESIMTLDDIRKMKDSDFVKNVQSKRVKMVVTNNEVSSVIISPDLYNVFLEAVDKLKAAQTTASPSASA